jgi:hypothetical protein
MPFSFGLPKNTVAPLQRVKNADARVISRKRKRDHTCASFFALVTNPTAYQIQITKDYLQDYTGLGTNLSEAMY